MKAEEKGSGSNEAVICRNKREILHKKEISCKGNTNTNGKTIRKVFSKLCREERGLKEQLGGAGPATVHELSLRSQYVVCATIRL